jgi:DNA-binding CsgD family transcriptional regulator
MNEPIELLRCHFGLTPAEARLALHLVAGETLRSAEVKLSISYETARTHLKNIFNKTGTSRQAELVIVIVTALPGCVRLGSNEQISGTNEQIPGGGQSDQGIPRARQRPGPRVTTSEEGRNQEDGKND